MAKVKAAPLPPQYEWPPTPVLPSFYRPLGGIEYKVKDGDTLQSLAQRAGLTVTGLLRFNFHTTNPVEVNWYLDFRVGCMSWSADQKSWKFGSFDSPGIIFFPPGHYPKDADQPAERIDESYEISPPLNYSARQMKRATCWAAAILTMLSWKSRKKENLDAIVRAVEQRLLAEFLAVEADLTDAKRKEAANTAELFRARAVDGRGLHASEILKLFDLVGLVPQRSFPSDEQWFQFLRWWGPLLAVYEVTPAADHCVVIVRVELSNKNGAGSPVRQLTYVDPSDTRRQNEDIGKFREDLLEGSFPGPKLWRI